MNERKKSTADYSRAKKGLRDKNGIVGGNFRRIEGDVQCFGRQMGDVPSI